MNHQGKRRRAGWAAAAILGVLAVVSAVVGALYAGTGNAGESKSLPTLSPRYDIYIGFTAERDCVPEKGPYQDRGDADRPFPARWFGPVTACA